MNRKEQITRELVLLAQEAESLKAQGESERLVPGRTAYTDAVAHNHVATVTMRRELAVLLRQEGEERDRATAR
jgi:hypothetical protein